MFVNPLKKLLCSVFKLTEHMIYYMFVFYVQFFFLRASVCVPVSCSGICFDMGVRVFVWL